MLKRIILSIIVLLLTGCTSYIVKDDNITLKIDSIDLYNEVNISSIKDDVEGIILFDEYGRPNIEGTNTIIGAHSGYGSNACFNNLIKLNKDDVIELIYEGLTYTYIVTDIYEVDDSDIDVLNSNGFDELTLITCNIKNTKKRIIVSAKPHNNTNI